MTLHKFITKTSQPEGGITKTQDLLTILSIQIIRITIQIQNNKHPLPNTILSTIKTIRTFLIVKIGGVETLLMNIVTNGMKEEEQTTSIVSMIKEVIFGKVEIIEVMVEK